ncbi:MAG TPA: hypothetical protein VGC79_20675 [Polyangiaceae bacterium]
MPRFSYALLGALALHGSLLLFRAHRSLNAPSSAAKLPPAQSLEFEEFPVEEAPLEAASNDTPPVALAEPRAVSAAASHLTGAQAKAAPAEVLASPEPAAAGDAVAAPIAVASAEAGDAQPPRKIDLGLDGHFFLHDPGPAQAAGPAPEAELGPRARKSTAMRQLQAALSADDVKRGLARGNALVGSLNAAARSDGPLRGEAIFRATIAADGSFGTVELVRGTAAEWSAVLSAFRKLAARKVVRLPGGAKGLRVTFSVKAKVQLPSGRDVNETAVRLADPSLGQNGFSPSGDFDLADLGASAQRLVYARVVSEEVL